MDKRAKPRPGLAAAIQEAVSATHAFNPIFVHFAKRRNTLVRITEAQLSPHDAIHLHFDLVPGDDSRRIARFDQP